MGLCYITGIWPYFHGFSITAMFFFSFGAYFSIFGKNLVEVFYRYNIISLFCIPVLIYVWCFDAFYTCSWMFYVFIMLGAFSFVNVSTIFTGVGHLYVPQGLSRITFLVYVSHAFISLPISKIILQRIIPQYDTLWVATIIYYLLIPVLVITISYLLNMILKRIY